DLDEPVRNARISLFGNRIQEGARRTAQIAQVQTDDRGLYHFKYLEAGKYVVAVSAQPWYAHHPIPVVSSFSFDGNPVTDPILIEGDEDAAALDVAYQITYYPGTVDPNSASLITLRAGDHFIADIQLTPVPAVHLRITNGDESQNIQTT